jgi:hypothetical protein
VREWTADDSLFRNINEVTKDNEINEDLNNK